MEAQNLHVNFFKGYRTRVFCVLFFVSVLCGVSGQ